MSNAVEDDEEALPAITPEVAGELLKFTTKRCELAELAGGIALEDVVDGVCKVPAGWWFDPFSWYYLPPTFSFGSDSQN